MIFNSFTFLVFFLIFFILYWFVFNKSFKLQNVLLLFGSYFFYAWWDWRLLLLLIGNSILIYYLGIYIHKIQKYSVRRLLLFTGIIIGLGELAFFKYYNFFVSSFIDAFSFFNIQLEARTLYVILPLGISYYTFRVVSYLLDVETEKIKPVKNIIIFLSYVSFFPSIVAGPIDRAILLVPQFEKERKFDKKQIYDGLRQILWGLFKKIVIADSCAVVVNNIFDNYEVFSGGALFIGAILYVIQMYADFSGYSDIAIGISGILGLQITKNFNFPFFAQNIADFWRRWHMSLTSWFTDYVFTPLHFMLRKYKKVGILISILINFTLVGIWHGANWTFVVFGFIHGLYFIPLILSGDINKQKIISKNRILPTFIELRNIVFTFLQVALTSIIFRAEGVHQAVVYWKRIFLFKEGSFDIDISIDVIFFVVLFIVIEWKNRDTAFGFELRVKNKYIRMSIYYAMILLIIAYFNISKQDFIYLHF